MNTNGNDGSSVGCRRDDDFLLVDGNRRVLNDRVEDVGGDLRVVVPVARIRSAAARTRIPSRAVCPRALAGRDWPRRTAGTAGGKSYKMPVSVEYHITALRPRAGRARDPVHRGILRRVPAQEDRGRDHAPSRAGARTSDPARDGAAARRPGQRRAGVVQGRPRDQRRRRPSRSSSTWCTG